MGYPGFVAAIDENHIEIGGEGHFPPPQLAQADNDELAARHDAMGALKFRFHKGQQALQGGVGNIAQRRAGFLAGDHGAQKLHADLEFPVMGPAPRRVEDVLKIARRRQAITEIIAQLRDGSDGFVELPGQHTVQEGRVAAQMLRQAGRAAHDLGE